MVSNQLSGRRSNPGTPKVCKIPPEKKWPPPPPPPPAPWPPPNILLDTQLYEPDYEPATFRHFNGLLAWDPEIQAYEGVLQHTDAYWSVRLDLNTTTRTLNGTAYGTDAVPHYWDVIWSDLTVPDPWLYPITLPIQSSNGSTQELDVIAAA